MLNIEIEESEKTSYDISGLDPIMVIQALFNNSKQKGWGLVAEYTEFLTNKQATQIYNEHIKTKRFIDWEFGRPFKISLLDMKKVNVSSYDAYNGVGSAKAAFDAVRNGTTLSARYNNSAEVKKDYEKNLQWMQDTLEGVVDDKGELVRHAIEQTEIDRPILNSFKHLSVSLKSTDDKGYEYLARINQLSNNGFNTCEKIKNEKNVIEKALTSKRIIYCESKLHSLNPEKNPVYYCRSYAGVMKCIEELKGIGCGFQLYISNDQLEKKQSIKIKS